MGTAHACAYQVEVTGTNRTQKKRRTKMSNERMPTNERMNRAMSFLMQLSDYIEMEMDPFARRAQKLIQDELVTVMGELNNQELPAQPPPPAKAPPPPARR